MLTRAALVALCCVALVGLERITIAEDARVVPADTAAGETAATAAVPPTPGLSGPEVYARMLPSTCWIRFEWTQDNLVYSSWGTGWIYDIGRRLVVTNEHVVHGKVAGTGFFPQEVDGELVHDPQWYLTSGQKFNLTVIDCDTKRDLALVQLDGLPDNAVALKLAEKSPVAGERVFALASLPEGSEGLWIMTTGEVRQVYRRSHANGHFARVVETQLPINRGNSGGAVVNDKLDVVAAVEGYRTDAQVVSMFIDVNEIRDYLNEAVPLVEPATAGDFEIRAARRYNESRYDQAIEDYSAALRLDPKLASALMNRGWAYLNQEDYQTAAADFDAALKLDPELTGAYEGRGTCRRELGDFKAAIRDLTEAIRRDSSDADTYERRAKCYTGLGRHADALKDRTRAVQLAPEYADYWMQRGQTYRDLKQFAAAQKDIEKAISLNPSSSAYYYELGHVFFDQEQYPQARLFFDMALQRDSGVASYVYMRGMSDFYMEQYEAAIADINQALALKPDTPHYYWNLGIATWNLDRLPESLQAYTDYIRVKPDDPAGYNDRADVHEAMGNEAAAAKDRAIAKKLEQKQ
jgi:tetratricopeptide (TPR) repeat protein